MFLITGLSGFIFILLLYKGVLRDIDI